MQHSCTIQRGITLFRDVWMRVSVQTTVSKHSYTSKQESPQGQHEEQHVLIFHSYTCTVYKFIATHNIVKKYTKLPLGLN